MGKIGIKHTLTLMKRLIFLWCVISTTVLHAQYNPGEPQTRSARGKR